MRAEIDRNIGTNRNTREYSAFFQLSNNQSFLCFFVPFRFYILSCCLSLLGRVTARLLTLFFSLVPTTLTAFLGIFS